MMYLLLITYSVSNAQTCHYKISGKVLDAQKLPIPGVVVLMVKDKTGTATDTSGLFLLEGVCPGKHTLVFEAISYKKTSVPINVAEDKNLLISLSANDSELGEVVVNGEKIAVQDLHTVTSVELKGVALLQTRGGSLGESLKELPGLNSIQTGPSLSKPVIHGLYSNRVLLINDGVRQEGQQWGSEHAPEIDPFIANKITVVKGAASVRYGSDAIGGVILLSPEDLPTMPGISGDVYLVGASNGQMGAFSGLLQGAFDKKLKGLSWRVQGTLKDAGNFHTPHYYLLNTGLREGDFSANLCYKVKRFDFDLYYSQFNTEVGIYLGAENNSIPDIQKNFLNHTFPSSFTYNITRSYQTVFHELLRAKATYDLNGKGKIEVTAGRQNDVRKEYDADVPNTPAINQYTIPQLTFQLITHTVDAIYTQQARNGFSGNMGVTGATSGDIQGGIRYLLPNFRSYSGGAFAIERYSKGKFTFEAGLRYDYRWMRVYERVATTQAIYNETYQYSNVSGTVGSTYHYNEHLSASLNTGTAWRAPSINEMYINGIHFSNASYEVGDSSLKSERALNFGLSVNYTSDKLRATVDAYYNSINNYIFEYPTLKYRVLSTGTFPEFDFTQADAIIKGVDAQLQYDFLPRFTFQSKTTIVRGYNETIHNWLFYMPADRFDNGVEFHLPAIGKLQQPYIAVSNLSVLKQTRVPPNSDFVAPPAGYSIFNVNAGFTVPVKKNSLAVNFAVNNVTNVAYRDYLNNFRYFVDDLGINYILRLKYSF
jgi:iron complex outermembrane receptor protein